MATVNNESVLHFQWKHFSTNFVHDFWKFFNSGQFSDVKLITDDGKTFRVHKIVLAVSSKYLQKIFELSNDDELKCGLLHIFSRIYCDLHFKNLVFLFFFSLFTRYKIKYIVQDIGNGLQW